MAASVSDPPSFAVSFPPNNAAAHELHGMKRCHLWALACTGTACADLEECRWAQLDPCGQLGPSDSAPHSSSGSVHPGQSWQCAHVLSRRLPAAGLCKYVMRQCQMWLGVTYRCSKSNTAILDLCTRITAWGLANLIR